MNVIVRTSIAHSVDSIKHVHSAIIVVCGAARNYYVSPMLGQMNAARNMSDVVETTVLRIVAVAMALLRLETAAMQNKNCRKLI